MKVYTIFHKATHENPILVGIYSSYVKAREETIRLEKEHFSNEVERWETMSTSKKKMWGKFETFAFSESWEVEEHEVKE